MSQKRSQQALMKLSCKTSKSTVKSVFCRRHISS
ncbi:unnamed protein product [Acanthoscelides obtectus]|uniref:Uncharacterized protein n=1 Tax=Acanthoscelides obtectus TaxID=200917 RepID=A0A9P0PRM0_ACAOB|nr:unnamed protein product [Acanthoscelides obtectus]CAK1651833.1 hypothetical protein AOBTE_LOCUS17487 [Acanthoscelides obtectus]